MIIPTLQLGQRQLTYICLRADNINGAAIMSHVSCASLRIGYESTLTFSHTSSLPTHFHKQSQTR